MTETKFRRLRRDELEEVRDQFVKFLGVNGIDAGSWQRMKEDEPARADALILQFSQLVFSGVLGRVEHLIERRPTEIRSYRAGADKLELRGVRVVGPCSLDLTRTDVSPQDMLITLRSEGAKLQLYSAERPYRAAGRERDLYELMEAGALIDPTAFFGVLSQL